MSNKKYPIGTKIKYVEPDPTDIASKDIGKIGKIVGYHGWNCPAIFLPESKHISCESTPQTPVSWACGWDSVEILLSQKNEQLLFAFME